MSCKLEKNSKGKITNVFDASSKPSTLFKQILNVPTLPLEQAIDVYKNVYSEQLKDKVRFQIIGEKGAQNLDQIEEVTFRMDNLKVAQDMEQLGKIAKEVRLATGWEKNKADGKWRYEILDGSFNDIILLNNQDEGILMTPVKLSDIYNNNELYSAYPDLKNLDVVVYMGGDTTWTSSGMFIGSDGKLYINGKEHGFTEGKNNISRPDTRTQLIHEIQHKIQIIEGFGRGSSVSENEERATKSVERLRNRNSKSRTENETDANYDRFVESYLKSFLGEKRYKAIMESDKLSDEEIAGYIGVGLYERFAGEVESVNVQTRFDMTKEERLLKTLEETQNIPYEDQYVEEATKDMFSQKTAGEISQELIDKLKQNGLSEDVFLMSTEEIDAKLKELGVSDDVRKQVIAYHGSPHSFERLLTKGLIQEVEC